MSCATNSEQVMTRTSSKPSKALGSWVSSLAEPRLFLQLDDDPTVDD
jgi:hypothetical protein